MAQSQEAPYNMANITLAQTWASGVYQLEQTDPVLGGTPVVGSPTKQGVDNWQAKQLGDRTEWLKPHVDMLRQIMILEGETISLGNSRQLYDTILGMISANSASSLPKGHLYTTRALKYDSTSQVSFPAEVICKDASDMHEIIVPANTTVSLATDLDTGTVAADTWYWPYAIKNTVSNAVDVILSTSTSAPVLPSGFTVYRKLPFPFRTRAATTDILKFQMVRSNGITRCRFIEDPITSGVSELELFTNLSSTGTLVNFSKIIPFGENGSTCTASLLLYSVGDVNSGFQTFFEKSTDDQVTWTSFGATSGNDNVSLEYPDDDFFLRPTGRNVHLRNLGGSSVTTRGRGRGYNLCA
jgi:hypothetical protein